MERKRHKHHRSHSPLDHEERKKRKMYQRHDSDLSEEEDSNRKKHHKHRRNKEDRRKHRSGSDEDHNNQDVDSGGDNHRQHLESAIIADNRRGEHSHRHSHHSDEDSRGNDQAGSRHQRHRSGRPPAEFDPSIRIKKEKDDRNFQEQQRERRDNNQRRRENRRDRDRAGGDYGLNTEAPARVKSEPGEESSQNATGGEKENADGAAAERQEPNFELSGKLTEDTNTFRGVVIKYNEPPEAMKPKRRWRLYPFKGQESLPVLHIHRQSAFLLGRDRRIADIPVDHPSCSKQQAVLQFRAMPYTRPDGTPGRRVRPYIIDLESANGTYLNGDKVDPKRYYELREKDVIKFGFSSREYVVLHDAVDLSEVAAGEDMEEA